jgi:hypothetical protein
MLSKSLWLEAVEKWPSICRSSPKPGPQDGRLLTSDLGASGSQNTNRLPLENSVIGLNRDDSHCWVNLGTAGTTGRDWEEPRRGGRR